MVKNIRFLHNMLPPPYCVTGPQWVNIHKTKAVTMFAIYLSVSMYVCPLGWCFMTVKASNFTGHLVGVILQKLIHASNKIQSKLCITDPFRRKFTRSDGLSAQKTSNSGCMSTSWHHHVLCGFVCLYHLPLCSHYNVGAAQHPGTTRKQIS